MRINESFFLKNYMVDTTNINFYDIKKTQEIQVYGLYNYKNESQFKRLPDDVAKATSEQVSKLYTNPAGGRIRFNTNSKSLVIRATFPNISTRSIITMLNQAGFDVYKQINGKQEFIGSLHPPIDLIDSYDKSINLGDGEKEITVYMPNYNNVSDVYIGIEKGAYIKPSRPYKNPKPILYYGSSITQGASVSRPGMIYESIISRALDTDFINLGFASGAKAENPIIDYMANIEYSIFVSDYDYNAPTPEYLEATHRNMYEKIRSKHPDVPYIMLTKPIIHHNQRNEENKRRHDIIFNTYENAIKNGDKNVYIIDGFEIFSLFESGDCSGDSVHPNDMGATVIAQNIIKLIKERNLLK